MIIRKFLITLVFFAIYFVVSTKTVSGSTYYVSNSGSDSNPGTELLPWKTISKVNNYYFSPGDFILFRKGDIWREQLIISSSGKKRHPITFGAYGIGDKPKILGSIAKNNSDNWLNDSGRLWHSDAPWRVGNLIMNAENNWAVMVPTKSDLDSQGKAWWDSSNSRIYLYSDGNPASFYNSSIELARYDHIVRVNDQGFITIDGLDLRYTGKNAIWLEKRSNGDHLKVRNCTTRFTGNNLASSEGGSWSGSGVFVNGLSNWEVTNCDISFAWIGIWGGKSAGQVTVKIQNNTISNTFWGDEPRGISFGSNTHEVIDYSGSVISHNDISLFLHKGISLSHASYMRVENNYVHNSYTDKHDATIGISMGAKPQHHNQVLRNHMYNIRGLNNDWLGGVGINTRSCHHCLVAYNIIHDSNVGILNYLGSTGGNNDHNQIYNNVAYNIDKYGLRVLSGVSENKTDIIIHNNIFDGNTYDIYINDDVNVIGGYNSLLNDSTILLGIGSTYIGGSNDLHQQNPLFTDPENFNFTLQPNSNLRDAGTDVGLELDFSGERVPQSYAPDIGAHEYEDNDPLPPTSPPFLTDEVLGDANGNDQFNLNNFVFRFIQYGQKISRTWLPRLWIGIMKNLCFDISPDNINCLSAMKIIHP